MSNLRTILGGVILTAACLAIVPTSQACINDRRSPEAERQMQDDYRPTKPMPSESAASSYVLAGMGAGGVLLLGSLAWSMWRNMIAVT